MHILEIPSFFPPYGGHFCIDQSRALAAQGHVVRVIAALNVSARLTPKLYLRASRRPYDVVMDGIEVTRCDLRSLPALNKLNARRWCRMVQRMADAYVRRYGKPDMLHAHCCAWAGYAAMLVAGKYGIPYVITEHLPKSIQEKGFGRQGAQSWQIPLLKRAYEKAAMVIPVAAELVDELAPYYGTAYHWTAVSNAIDTKFYAYKERPDTGGSAPAVVCCVADFVHRKGYDILFEAIRLYHEKHDKDIHLIIAGRGTESTAMRDLIHQYALDGVVEVCGQVDREGVRRILYRSQCLMLATRGEVQPLVLLEAMSTGMPVVSTEVVPQCERIDGACFIGQTDNAASLCAQLYKALHQPHFNGKAISAQVADMASYDSVGKQLSQLFDKVQGAFKSHHPLAQ